MQDFFIFKGKSMIWYNMDGGNLSSSGINFETLHV